MTITATQLNRYRSALQCEEKSAATVTKYLRDVRRFAQWLGDTPLTHDAVLAYKDALLARFSPSSVNAALAAINGYLHFAKREDCRVRRVRVQYQPYTPEEQELTAEDYAALVHAAQAAGDVRTALLLQTICATGIRVSELPAVTVEAAQRGVASVRCKGKTRRVLLPTRLQHQLLRYAAANRLTGGAIFVTRNGRPLDRSNVWRDMKSLCRAANVAEGKVFPHNLRHLFARSFYDLDRDIAKLADLLGHSSIDTTRIYIRTTAAEHLQSLERMELVL